MAVFRPAWRAIRKKADVTFSLCGRPKETFETPRDVYTPSSLRMRERASRVTSAASCPALTAIVSGSIMISCLPIPYSAAVSIISFAASTRPCAVSGIPSSVIVSPITTPPYFLTRGNMASIEERLAVTEFTRGLPLYIRIAAAMVSGSDVSICSGKGEMDCNSVTTSHITERSSISGRPTFTSRICAPASCWAMPSLRINGRSLSRKACLNLDFPVGFIRSPIIMGLSPNSTALLPEVTTVLCISGRG